MISQRNLDQQSIDGLNQKIRILDCSCIIGFYG